MTKLPAKLTSLEERYQLVSDDVAGVVNAARLHAIRCVNAVMTAAYWLIERHIAKFEQAGEERTKYRTALIERLAIDFTKQFDRGFSRQNIWQMRLFYQTYPPERILQIVSGESGMITTSSTTKKSVRRTLFGLDHLTLSAAVVRLCAPAFGQEHAYPDVLRDRRATRRLGARVNLTGKSTHSSTSAPHSRRTRPPC